MVYHSASPSPIGEPVKTTRISVLLALLLCFGAQGIAQSNAKPDYKSQHKSAQKYQKSIQKQRKKQLKQEAKASRRIRKQHQQ
jgi:hypothetical protein